MADNKPQENTIIESMNHAVSKMRTLFRIKIGLLLVVFALLIQGFANATIGRIEFEISTIEYYGEIVIPLLGLTILCVVLGFLFLATIFVGLVKYCRPRNPLLFDRIALVLCCLATFCVDIMVSFFANINLPISTQ